MQNPFKILSTKNFVLFFICTLFIGICSNRVLMSTSMMGLFFTVLIGSFNNKNILSAIQKFLKDGVFLSIILIILIPIVGCIHSTNLSYAWKLLVLGSPFLFVPISMGLAPSLTKKEFVFLIYVFCIVLFITGTIITINYLMHYDLMNDALGRGKAIETPFREHIRYSLMMSFCVVALIYLLFNQEYIHSSKLEKYLQVVFLILFVLMLHILSVRSGLLSLYICFILYSFYFSFYKKKYLLSLAVILLVILLPIFAYQMMPSLQKKMSYMFYDIEMLSKGKGRNFSDSERIISMVAGMKIVKTNFWFGVGTGDIKDEMNKVYARDYPYIEENNRKLPHNQFIWVWASNGFFALISFLVAILYPLFFKKNYKNILLLMFSIITLSSFLTEHTLEIQVGIAFYVIWFTIILNYLNGARQHENSI